MSLDELTATNTVMTLHQQWLRLLQVIQKTLHPTLAARYILMCEALKDDIRIGEKTLLGMYRAPGATRRHHRHEGGLVYHYLEMWDAWEYLRVYIRDEASPPLDVSPKEFEDHLSDSRVLRAILNHDIHKARRRYVLISADPWETNYADKDDDFETRLLTTDGKSLLILHEHQIPMDLIQLNALVRCEGGFSDLKTEWETVLAKLVYILDEFSANVLSRTRANLLMHSHYTKNEISYPTEHQQIPMRPMGAPDEIPRVGT